MDKVLLVDDNAAVLEALSLLLEIHGFTVVTASTPAQAIQIVSYQRIALVIQDMNFTADTTSGEEGKHLFYALRDINPLLPIVLITAWTELSAAVELVKAGAADYLAKPWDDDKLVNTVTNLIALGKANQQSQKYVQQQAHHQSAKNSAQQAGLVYESAAMQQVVDMALQVAKSDVSVLITGPNGCGKEKIAELIQQHSPLLTNAFIKINAGALPQELIEAELFGAEAGAYTGANKAREGRFDAAHGGTLFLDEIGNLPLSGQIKLLRVLQTGEFERLGSTKTRHANVRIISATNANLLEDIQRGTFREDLYYRLNVIELRIPPLCERKEDILPLIHYFLPERECSVIAEKALLAHHWPGNVRELENACKRVAILKPQGVLEAEDFGVMPHTSLPSMSATVKHATSTPAEPSKTELEQALAQHQGVIARVAKQFGLSRQSLYRRLTKYGIEY